MSDPYVESYKKSLAATVDKHGKEFEKLVKVFNDLLMSFLVDHYDKVRDDLEAKLKKIAVPPQADDKELAKVPAWLEEQIKKTSAVLGAVGTTQPQVRLDLKAKKLVSVAIGFAYS